MFKQITPPHTGNDRVINFITSDFRSDKIISDLKNRSEIGYKKYGHYLESFNGRNSLQDAYEESLDMCMYLKQSILETKTIKKLFLYNISRIICIFLSRQV
jgi:hypothetical protein